MSDNFATKYLTIDSGKCLKIPGTAWPPSSKTNFPLFLFIKIAPSKVDSVSP